MRRPAQALKASLDITAELPLAPAPDWAHALFDHSAVGIALLDDGARIAHANPAFARFLGVDPQVARTRHIADFSDDADAQDIAFIVAEVASNPGASRTVEVSFRRPDGVTVYGAVTISSANTEHGQGFLVVVQDVTERKALEARVVHQAFHDPLTELANRALFRDRVAHALSRNARRREQLAVLVVGLDKFKSVNDTQGHTIGDRVLRVLADRLLNATRGCDTVARLGGDEFGVLLEHVDADASAQSVAQRIVAALRHPLELPSGTTLIMSASVGIALYSGAESADELLRNADVAMHEAKLRASGRWVVFRRELHAALLDQVTLESDLRAALQRCQLADRPRLAQTSSYPAFTEAKPAASGGECANEFSVHYQPIVNLATGRITGMEALARWTHPERGPVPPQVFIPVAERCGAIFSLGRWLLGVACRQAAAWNAMRPAQPLKLTVNLSGQQLDHAGLPSEIDAVLRETGLPPSCLALEITETVIMRDAEAALEHLRELKRVGVCLAIDDFGTGYSSLSYLQQFPVDVLKIDRAFISALRDGSNGGALVRTIVTLAGMLSLSTIAEGVEKPGERKQLRALGCHEAQGYLFGRPAPAAEMERLLSAPPGRRATSSRSRKS